MFLCNGLLDLFVLFDDKISKFVANVGTLFVSSCHEELASTFVCQKRERERERKKSIEVKLHEQLWHTHTHIFMGMVQS